MSREIGLSSEVAYGIGDTGATDHLCDSSMNPMLYDAVPATTRYQTAGEGTIRGDLKGKMDVTVLNLDHQPKGPPSVDHTLTATTVKGLGPSLWSLEQEFRDNGYDIHLTHGYKKGDYTGMYRPPESGKPESFIPMVYNHEGSGGWRVPYLIRKPGTTDAEHQATLSAVLAQHELDSARSARIAAKQYELTAHQAKLLEEYYWACPAVSQTATVRVPGERNIRPAFTYGGLRKYKAKNWHEFHSAMAHFGEPGKHCVVCDMFKGAARRMPKHTQGKPCELRPGVRWHMDMITFRHRSEEGSKYLIVLTDEATQFYQLIPLHWKSDAVYELKRWITAMRAHPALKGCPYTFISQIFTDNESVWGPDASEFSQMIDEVGGIEVDYGDPADHARDNARAEGANKIIEAGIQSLLYEKNLPPSWWQRAANDVMFLANRFPPYSMDAAVPLDGDMPSPIERLFNSYVSRHQVYREIDSYVAVGTPALCYVPTVKGSDLEPRVRWGIAVGQRGKVVQWMCPFTKSRFRNRSYTSFTLRTGLNWSQFLGLGDISTSKLSQMYPGEGEPEGVVQIELPAVRANTVLLPPPVREVTDGLADGSVNHTVGRSKAEDGHQLCEFFPRIKQLRPIPTKDKSADESTGLDPDDGTQVGAPDQEDEEQLSETDPVPEVTADANTPGVRVLDSRGQVIGTRPSLAQVDPAQQDDPDDLYIEGSDDVVGRSLPPPSKRQKRISSRDPKAGTKPKGGSFG